MQAYTVCDMLYEVGCWRLCLSGGFQAVGAVILAESTAKNWLYFLQFVNRMKTTILWSICLLVNEELPNLSHTIWAEPDPVINVNADTSVQKGNVSHLPKSSTPTPPKKKRTKIDLLFVTNRRLITKFLLE